MHMLRLSANCYRVSIRVHLAPNSQKEAAKDLEAAASADASEEADYETVDKLEVRQACIHVCRCAVSCGYVICDVLLQLGGINAADIKKLKEAYVVSCTMFVLA